MDSYISEIQRLCTELDKQKLLSSSLKKQHEEDMTALREESQKTNC